MGKISYYTVNGKIRGQHVQGDAEGKDYLLDASGNLVGVYQGDYLKADAAYDPFGNILDSWNISFYNFTWAGGHGYRQTGLAYSSVYVRARHYSNLDGGWTTRDPLWPSEMPYGYVDGRVPGSVDYWGMRSKSDQTFTIRPEKASKKDPCSCPKPRALNDSSGYVYIDCNCLGMQISVLNDHTEPVLDPQCGRWLKVDAVTLHQAFPPGITGTYKIHGQTCSVVDCGFAGAPTFLPETCCSGIAKIRKKCEPTKVDLAKEFGRHNLVCGPPIVVK